MDLSEVGVVLTGGVFLLGFMLTGTLADYKESERLPAELSCALEAIEELLALAAIHKSKIDVTAQRRLVLEVTNAIQDRLLRKMDQQELYARLSRLNLGTGARRSGASMLLSGRLLGEMHNLRRLVTRIDVISRTSFLASGYALLETLVVAVIGLVLAARCKSPVTTYTLVTFVSMIFVYMLRLIRDVDDPFEYSSDGTTSGAAEVDLFPLREYQARLAQRIADSGK